MAGEEHFNRTGEANVKDWGAVGDNKADDTAAFEEAIEVVVKSAAGGVLFIPPGVYRISKRLQINTKKPFVIRGAAQDLSRLLWPKGTHSEGIEIKPQGDLRKFWVDGSVTVEKISLMCPYEREARHAALLIDGEFQLDTTSNKLTGRPLQRFRVSDLAITGMWRYGLHLHCAHLCVVWNLNIVGEKRGDDCNGCMAAILMDGVGSPTDHSFTNCSIFAFDTGILLHSDRQGRIEGVKVHNCEMVNVVTGVRADCVLHLSCVQNHMNCTKHSVELIDSDQCFCMANLFYHHGEDGGGVRIASDERDCKGHVINGNCIVAVKKSQKMTAVQLDGRVRTAVVANNVTVQPNHIAGAPDSATLRNVFCAGNVATLCKHEGYHLPQKGVTVDATSFCEDG